jgi:anti-sigma regulatory factor (Ser/Thr protein kinase)
MVSGTTISHRHTAGQPLSVALAPALAAATGFASQAGLDPIARHRLAIVVEELIANLGDHAARGRDFAFTLALEHAASGLWLVLEDDCPAFDPRHAAPIEMPNAERGGGGGLALVRAWCEIVTYDSDAAGNWLTLRFRSAA